MDAKQASHHRASFGDHVPDTAIAPPSITRSLDEAWADYAKRLRDKARPRDLTHPEDLPPGYAQATIYVVVAEWQPDWRPTDDALGGYADERLRAGPYTPEELTERRAQAIGELPMSAHFSCDECGAAAGCPFAFDTYNTNGDCLAEK